MAGLYDTGALPLWNRCRPYIRLDESTCAVQNERSTRPFISVLLFTGAGIVAAGSSLTLGHFSKSGPRSELRSPEEQALIRVSIMDAPARPYTRIQSGQKQSPMPVPAAAGSPYGEDRLDLMRNGPSKSTPVHRTVARLRLNALKGSAGVDDARNRLYQVPPALRLVPASVTPTGSILVSARLRSLQQVTPEASAGSISGFWPVGSLPGLAASAPAREGAVQDVFSRLDEAGSPATAASLVEPIQEKLLNNDEAVVTADSLTVYGVGHDLGGPGVTALLTPRHWHEVSPISIITLEPVVTLLLNTSISIRIPARQSGSSQLLTAKLAQLETSRLVSRRFSETGVAMNSLSTNEPQEPAKESETPQRVSLGHTPDYRDSARSIALPSMNNAISRPRQTSSGIEFEVSTRLNGASAGRLQLLIADADMHHPEEISHDISVRIGDLIELFRSRFKTNYLESVAASGHLDRYVTLNMLRSMGISVSFDDDDNLEFGAI